MTRRTTSCTVYRCRAADGDLLYVGATILGGKRLMMHGQQKWWWAEVARVDLEHFDSVDAARAAESVAIDTECPKYNVRLSGRLDRSGYEAASA